MKSKSKEYLDIMHEMKTHVPYLSICIPTYNRLHYLKESLDILLPQAEELEVEVCVSNNKSTDGTASYLDEMATKFSCLRFINQEMNISLDLNMGAALSMGKGAYLYPIGDDDVIPAKSLAEILQELDGEVDVVIQNGWLTDAKLFPQGMLLPLAIQGSQFVSPKDAFISLWDKMPFGSFLATRECFDAVLFEKYIGTSHAYTGTVWQAIASKYNSMGFCKIKCMIKSMVLLRGGEKSWRNDSALIMLYQIPKWFRLLMEDKEYEVVAEQFRTKFIRDQISFESLLQYTSYGQLDSKMLNLLRGEYTAKEFNKVKWVALIPALMARFLIQLRKYPVLASRRFLKSIRKLVVGY